MSAAAPRRRPAAKGGASPGEELLALHLRAYREEIPEPIRQYAFAAELGRGYRFDLCWPSRKLAVEIDGAVHRIKGRFAGDMERQNIAQVLGWRVLRFSTADVRSAKALDAVRALLAGDESAALAALQRK